MVDKEPNQAQKDSVNESRDEALKYLRKKAMGSVQNTVKHIVWQSTIRGLFFAFLLIGLLVLVNASKDISGAIWQRDLIISLTLITIGGLYMVIKIRHK